MLGQYSIMPQGLWLQELPWTQLQFLWCPAMVGSFVMGAFSPVYQNRIFLVPQKQDCQPVVMDPMRYYWLELLFTTIIHQCRHAYQWRKSKLLYTLCSLPGIRQLTIEKDAIAAQQDAQQFIRRWSSQQDFKQAYRQGRTPDIA